MKIKELPLLLTKITGNPVNQSLLAKSLGITRQTISIRIKNDSEVTVSEINKIEHFFGVNLTDVVPEVPGAIGKRFKNIREDLRLTQQALGDKIGISKQAVSNVENNLSNPSIDVISKLIVDFKVNANYLISGVGSMFIKESDDDFKNKIEQEVERILKAKGIE